MAVNPTRFTVLRFFCAIFASAAFSVSDACGIEGAADDMITDARQVSYSSASDKDSAVLLQIMVDARDIGGDFLAVGKSYTGDFPQRGVGLFGRLRPDYEADPAFLRRA